MTHWNYRVARTPDGYTIREIYYDDGDVSWTYPMHPHGDTRAELRADLLRMLDALDHPTLIDKDQP